MVKSFLIIIICQIFVYAQEQLVLVVADNINSRHADMYCYENKTIVLGPLKVNLGAGGLGFGVGEKRLKNNYTNILKYEGDNKTPIGIYPLDSVFGYAKRTDIKMPYIYASKDTICVDDPESLYYNRIIKKPAILPKSFEEMSRDDAQYELGVVIGYNKEQLKGRGSCIFLHVEKSVLSPTAGCTSMSYENMKKVVEWLDIKKEPKIMQITREELKEAKELYPFIKL